LEQKKIIFEKHIMWVYKIQEALQKKQIHDKIKLAGLKTSAGKSDNSGSHCSTSSTFYVKQMLTFLIIEFRCVIMFSVRDPKSRKPLVPSFRDNGSHTVL
jgi:hypothetical protein